MEEVVVCVWDVVIYRVECFVFIVVVVWGVGIDDWFVGVV